MAQALCDCFVYTFIHFITLIVVCSRAWLFCATQKENNIIANFKKLWFEWIHRELLNTTKYFAMNAHETNEATLSFKSTAMTYIVNYLNYFLWHRFNVSRQFFFFFIKNFSLERELNLVGSSSALGAKELRQNIHQTCHTAI